MTTVPTPMATKASATTSPRHQTGVGVDGGDDGKGGLSPGATAGPRGAASVLAAHTATTPLPASSVGARRATRFGESSAKRMSTVASARATRDVPTDRRLEGWSIIGKITRFVHAVGRVNGGRGSAILVALPERNDKERAVVSSNAELLSSQRGRRHMRRGRTLTTVLTGEDGDNSGGSAHDTPPPMRSVSSRGCSLPFRATPSVGGARHSSWSGASVAWDPLLNAAGGGGEGARRGTRVADGGGDGSAAASLQSPLAVLLTTSSVLGSREDAAGATVTFMEQPVAGTAAQLGRDPQPFTVSVRSEAGFVCSVAPDERRARTRMPWPATSTDAAGGHIGQQREHLDWGGGDSAQGQSLVSSMQGSQGRGSCDSYSGGRGGDNADTLDGSSYSEGEDAVPEEIGYTLTYCDVEPRGRTSSFEGGDRSAETGNNRTKSRNTNSSSSSRGTSMGSAGMTCPCRDTTMGCSRLSSSAVADNIATTDPKRQRLDSVFLVKPLPLPLLLSAIQPVAVGDTHLMVTHVDGRERHYLVQRVSAVHQDFCEYQDDPTLVGDFCSGGAVFNLHGDFIGLQHRLGSQSICMFTSSIVKNLFLTNKLGMCRTPISNQPLPDDGAFGQRVVTTREHVPVELFNQPFSFTQQSSVTDVGVEGDRLINYDDLERARKYRERPVPLTEREPSFSEVYKEFYTGFDSLTHMLNAFYYCPSLTAKVLETMVSVKYRGELQKVASSGGVGMVLEVMDGYPDMESLVITSLSALSRMCLHPHNLAAFVVLDGVATVLEIMKEYPHSPQILQWGAYCLAHVTRADAPSVKTTVGVLLRCNMVELAVSALRAHGSKQEHMSRWLCVVLANLVETEPRAVALYVQDGLPDVVLDLVEQFTSDSSTLARLLALLRSMLLPLCDELPAEFASLDEQRMFEDLRPFVCTSPLSVSAYFLYTTLASRPVAEKTEAERWSPEASDCPCSCPHCPACHRQGQSEQGEEGIDTDAMIGRGGSPPATDGRPSCHCRPPVPCTALNRIVMAILDRESREHRNNASVDLLAVCLDLLLVLDNWGLFPVHYQPSEPEALSFLREGNDTPLQQQQSLRASPPLPSAPVDDSTNDANSNSGSRGEGTAPSMVAARGRDGADIDTGAAFTDVPVQRVLDRIKVNYFASVELVARVDQFACDAA